MSFTLPVNDDRWARDKDIKTWCNDHKIWYDRHLDECPEHKKEREAREFMKQGERHQQVQQILDLLDIKPSPPKKKTLVV